MAKGKAKGPKSKARAKATSVRAAKATVKKGTHRVSPPAPQWKIRVARFNPQMDYVSRTHEYLVAPKEGESVLDVLTRLKHTQDGSLTFRGSCGYGGCGACGVRVNGVPVLGCVTQVSEVVDKHRTLRIDPLEPERVLKDLVIDERPFFEELLKVKPWLVPRKNESRREHRMGVQDVQKLGNSPQCILCGLCNASAESSKTGEMGPAAFVKGFRYASDIRDGDAQRWNTLSSRLPVHYSLEKANLCPRDLYPGDKIKFVRSMQSNSKAHGRKGTGSR